MANILIIDDDKMILRVVSRILSMDQHTVTTAEKFSDNLMKQIALLLLKKEHFMYAPMKCLQILAKCMTVATNSPKI